MSAVISLRDIKDPNKIGEIMRAMYFTPGGYGCYSNFDLIDGFKELDKASPRATELFRMMGWSFDCPEEMDELEAEIRERATLFTNGGVEVAWYWDHDGTLLFVVDGIAIVNDDCKKATRWRFVPPQGLNSFSPPAGLDADAATTMVHPIYGDHNRLIRALQMLLSVATHNTYYDLEPLHGQIVGHAVLGGKPDELKAIAADIMRVAQKKKWHKTYGMAVALLRPFLESAVA